MYFFLDTLIVLISLLFLAILGTVAGALIPTLFLPAFAPWLDRILPGRQSD